MKRIVLAFLVFSPLFAGAQTTLKWNALYFAAGVINMSVETRLGGHLTLDCDAVYSPWESVNGKKARFGQFIAQLRYYPRGSFDGFYVAPYGALHAFRMTKWNYYGTNYYQKGDGGSLGVVAGYQWKLSPRWNLDAFIGGGWQLSGYQGYDDSTKQCCVLWNHSGEWIPYMAGLSFAYKISRGRR